MEGYESGQDDMPCPHATPAEDAPAVGFFALRPAPCRDCAEARRQYRDVYLAMAGNVYAIARLAGDGLISGTGATLPLLEALGKRLYQALAPDCAAWVEADALEALEALEAVGLGR